MPFDVKIMAIADEGSDSSSVDCPMIFLRLHPEKCSLRCHAVNRHADASDGLVRLYHAECVRYPGVAVSITD